MITVKIKGLSGTIIIDRQARCNALDRTTISELGEALDDLRQEKKIRGVIITGSGAHFCAGMDLKELQETSTSTNPMASWFTDAQAIQSLLLQMLHFPKPIIAAVDGTAAGAGLAIALASDLIVATENATFAAPATKHGLVSGFTTPLLHFRLGGAFTSRLVIGAEELSGNEAFRVGLVQRIVPSDQIWVSANDWISKIAEGAAESIQLSKKVLNEMVGEQLSTMLSNGAAATATSLTTEAAIEGLNAFVAKRAPSFP